MQAIFGKNFKGGIKLRSYCKNHSPTVSESNGIISQADKIDASGVKEIDMTNMADDRLQGGNEELDYFWKYVDINEVHKNISDAYTRAKRLKSGPQPDEDVSADDHKSTPKKKNKKNNLKADASPTKTKGNTPKKTKIKLEKESFIDDDAHEGQISSIDDDLIPEFDPLMLDLIYRYWILLRTINNGQSLIKFSPSALKEREFEQRKSIMKLRIELERVRNLSYMIGKREKLKSSWLKTHQNVIKRTFSVINDLNPALDIHNPLDSSNSDNLTSSNTTNQTSSSHHHLLLTNGKKSLHSTQHLQPTNGMFDESEQLISDLITCDQIYEVPNFSTNSNYGNLSYQERSTLERRRTLSLVRRINRQLKSVNVEPSLNPYAKSYLVPKRSDSPVGVQQSPASKMLKYR